MPDRRDPPEGPTREEILAISQEIAIELGGRAYTLDDLSPSPVRRAGPDEWRLPDQLDGQRYERYTQSGPSWVRDTPGAGRVLGNLGLKPRDLTVYGSFPVGSFAGLVAYNARFADPRLAVEEFKSIFEAPDTRWESTVLGELGIERGTTAEWGPMGTIYLWADASCVYQIVGPDGDIARRLAAQITPFHGTGPTDDTSDS